MRRAARGIAVNGSVASVTVRPEDCGPRDRDDRIRGPRIGRRRERVAEQQRGEGSLHRVRRRAELLLQRADWHVRHRERLASHPLEDLEHAVRRDASGPPSSNVQFRTAALPTHAAANCATSRNEIQLMAFSPSP